MNPVTNNNSVPIRNNFSIENILSKPDRIAQPPFSVMYASNNGVEGQGIFCKIGQDNSIYDENSNIEENGNSDVKSELSESRNSFATPDSSCCEDGADTLSDIPSEENCE